MRNAEWQYETDGRPLTVIPLRVPQEATIQPNTFTSLPNPNKQTVLSTRFQSVTVGTVGAIATSAVGLAINLHFHEFLSSILLAPIGFVLATSLIRSVRESFRIRPGWVIGLTTTMLTGWVIARDFVGNNRVSEFMTRQVIARYHSDELKYCCVSTIFGILYVLIIPSGNAADQHSRKRAA